jgi:hypothetical protein
MSENTLVNDTATEATDVISETQAQVAKTYSQQEVDNMMARMKGSLEKKLLKPYEDLGDPSELRNIKSDYEKRQQEQQVKKGEFEKILQEKAQKWEAEIQKRDSVIKEYKVNSPLLSAAAKYRAVAPEQVKSLLSSNVRLSPEGDVEVVGNDGTVRYNDAGAPLAVDDLVREFLDSNPHFVTAGASTTNAKSSISNMGGGKLDVSKLDMTKATDRAVYKEYKKANGLL